MYRMGGMKMGVTDKLWYLCSPDEMLLHSTYSVVSLSGSYIQSGTVSKPVKNNDSE